MKRCFLPALTIAIVALCAAPATALSDNQKNAVSENCTSIQQSLRTLQRSDSRTRVYLGSVYQVVLTNYLTPLNLRLVKNNQPDAGFANDQSDFTAARDEASQKFITYSQALEELLLTDCVNHPEDFYNKLTEARKKRTELSDATIKVKKILGSHIEAVVKLKEDL